MKSYSAFYLVLAIFGAFIGGHIIGHRSGQKEAPRVLSDKEACERWADRCDDQDGRAWFFQMMKSGSYEAICDSKSKKIEVK